MSAANSTHPARNSRLALSPPARFPPRAASSAPGISATSRLSSARLAPLASAISLACPSKPKPVTSVAACTATSNVERAVAALRFNSLITFAAASTQASSAVPRLSAVVITPVPMALVSSRRSPGRAPALVQIFSGCTVPVTA